jgi:HSP20 family molecular chaperone IbpA
MAKSDLREATIFAESKSTKPRTSFMTRMVDPLTLIASWQRAGETGPPVDLYETEAAVIIRLAIPGGDIGALALTIGKESIRVRGETPPPAARVLLRSGPRGNVQSGKRHVVLGHPPGAQRDEQKPKTATPSGAPSRP